MNPIRAPDLLKFSLLKKVSEIVIDFIVILLSFYCPITDPATELPATRFEEEITKSSIVIVPEE